MLVKFFNFGSINERIISIIITTNNIRNEFLFSIIYIMKRNIINIILMGILVIAIFYYLVIHNKTIIEGNSKKKQKKCEKLTSKIKSANTCRKIDKACDAMVMSGGCSKYSKSWFKDCGDLVVKHNCY